MYTDIHSSLFVYLIVQRTELPLRNANYDVVVDLQLRGPFYIHAELFWVHEHIAINRRIVRVRQLQTSSNTTVESAVSDLVLLV